MRRSRTRKQQRAGRKKPPVTLALLASGGPASGFHPLMYAATKKANEHGIRVVGIKNGYRWLVKEGGNIKDEHVRFLDTSELQPIRTLRGCILGTSRTHPKTPDERKKVLDALDKLGVKYLIPMAGDDGLETSMQLQKDAGGKIAIAHAPKTIDNDLILPDGESTFGYNTARYYGAIFVQSLVADSNTTGLHCHIVVTMGRSVGFLALGIGKDARADLTIIPEEFGRRTIRIEDICDIIEGAFIKMCMSGRSNMVVVLAEGLVSKMSLPHLHETFGPASASRDAQGNLQLRDIEFGPEVCGRLKARCARYSDTSFIHHKLGYTLRGEAPTPTECSYCNDLGSSGMQGLLDGNRGFLISTRRFVPFKDYPRQSNGRPRIRRVNTRSSDYRRARDAMTRLGPGDNNPQIIGSLARTAKLSPAEFTDQFGHLMKK